MSIEVIPGVHVHVIPTEQFKTNQIMIRFMTPLTLDKIQQRSLLASIMENSSQMYPNPQAMNQALAAMYGARYGVDITRHGNEHEITFTMDVVNDHYLNGETNYLHEAFQFLNTVIFQPLTEGHAFQAALVAREKRHLMNMIAAMKDDKQDYALLCLQQHYFDDDAQRVPYYGTEEGIASITAEALYQAYQDMIFNDAVSITVVGDVSEAQVLEEIQQFKFSPRNSMKLDLFYYQPLHQATTLDIETQAVTQSKLTLAYQTGVYLGEVPYYTLLVFNGLFGGFPHSKLFMNVREKHSLAYYASSYIDGYRGQLVVQAGINRENRERVLSLIEDQLQALCLGQFTDDVLQKTKRMLINQYIAQYDRSRFLAELAQLQWLFDADYFDSSHYCQSIQDVSKEDVAILARRIYLQTIFCLEGSEA